MLTVLVASGIIGGGLYVLLWGATLAGALVSSMSGARREAVVWVTGGIAAYAVQAQFSIPDVALSMVTMTLLGALAGLSAVRRPRVIRVSVPMRRLAGTGGAVAGGALCLAAVALVAGDAFDARGDGAVTSGSASGIARLRWAGRIDPLQAAYLDDLARAHESSVRVGVPPEGAYTSALATEERRIDRFGGLARDHLAVARDAALLSRLGSGQGLAFERHLVEAARLDPKNPGLAQALADVRAIAASPAAP
jgi:hypothetical protein